MSKPTNVFVVAGHWNPSIFTKDWAAEFLFPGKEVAAELSVEKHYAIRLRTEDLHIHINEVSLRINIIGEVTSVKLSDAQDVILKLCTYLSHTPASALGINFTYPVAEKVLSALLELKDLKALAQRGFGAPTKVEVRRTFPIGDNTLNILVYKNNQDLGDVVSFNYHFEIKRVLDIQVKLQEKDVLSFQTHSKEIFQEIYGIEERSL